MARRTTKRNAKRNGILAQTEAQQAELVRVVAASLGREPAPHELHPQLMRMLKANAELADDFRRQGRHLEATVKRWESALNLRESNRAELRRRLGYIEPQSFFRPRMQLADGLASAKPVRLPDTIEQISHYNPAKGIVQTRAKPLAVLGYGDDLGEASQVPLDQRTGVVGTPFVGGLPYMEDQMALYPMRARGFGNDPGALSNYHRHDGDINQGVADLVSVFAGATVEAQVPEYLTPTMAHRFGINRDAIMRACDEFNASFHLGAWGRPVDLLKSQLSTAVINGASVAEMGIDPTAHVTKRIKWIAPRSPNTWMRWLQDPVSGAPIAIQQINANYAVQQPSEWLDLSRCMHIAVDQLGDNFEGISLLRAAYAYDLLTTEMVQSVLMHIQRFGQGVPIVRSTDKARESAQGAVSAFDAISQFYNIKDAAIKLGFGVELEILQMQLQNAGFSDVMETCRAGKRAALRMALAGMGQDGSSGSYALAQTKDNQWLRGLITFAADAERGLNQLLAHYARHTWNLDDLVVLPEIKLSGFATKDALAQLNAQRQFIELRADLAYSDEEMREISDQTGVVWHGRGDSADTSEGARLAETEATAMATGGEGVATDGVAIVPALAQDVAAVAVEAGAVEADAAELAGMDSVSVAAVAPEPLPVGSLQMAVTIVQALRPADEATPPLAPTVAVELLVAAGLSLSAAERMVAAQMAATAPEALKVDETGNDGDVLVDDSGTASGSASELPRSEHNALQADAGTDAAVTSLNVPEGTTEDEGTKPPAGAMKAAATALVWREQSAGDDRGLNKLKHLQLARKIASGHPLTGLELAMIAAWFETAGDVESQPGFSDHGPLWQEYNGRGGDVMREWITGHFDDAVDADADADDGAEDDAAPAMRAAHHLASIDCKVPVAALRSGSQPMMRDGRARDELTLDEWQQLAERFSALQPGDGWDAGSDGYPSTARQQYDAMGGDVMYRKAMQVMRQRQAAHHAGCGCTDCED